MVDAWKKKSSTYLVRRDWMNLRRDHVLLPSGVEIPEFHVVEYPDWVGVLALTVDDKVVMVEQYRHGIEEITLELPAGRVDDTEDTLGAGKRELLEETGFSAERWQLLGRCAPEPAKHSNYAHLYFAGSAVRIAEPDLDHSEDLIVRLIPRQQLVEQSVDGQLLHGIHLTAIFWARMRGLI